MRSSESLKRFGWALVVLLGIGAWAFLVAVRVSDHVRIVTPAELEVELP